LPDYDPKQVEARLDARMREIEARRAALRAAEEDTGDELADYDQHPGDQGTETFQQELEETTEMILEEEARRVAEAREQLEKGNYGTCVDCGQEIPAERLEAVPESTRCVKDQTAYEARHRQISGGSGPPV
jgi:RNA polymerase-binding transcription factor DksA